MKAAIFRTVHQPLTIEEVDLSAPGPHEVCVRTAAAGVCHSDVHFQQGLYPCPTPIVLGHESAGIVDAVGSEVRYVQPGDHVITCLSVFCGHCNYCTTGRTSSRNRIDTMRRTDNPHGSHNGGKSCTSSPIFPPMRNSSSCMNTPWSRSAKICPSIKPR